MKAILAVNMFAICNVISMSSYKTIARGGVHFGVFIFCRSVFTLTSASIDCLRKGASPFKDIPDEDGVKWRIFGRAVTGNCAFILFNSALPYVSIFISRVLLQLSPLWIALLSFCINGDKV